ncbi:MAG TPA: hypothetical protein DEQ02_02325 [Ruminococcaceae bacterium]|nr:hypothetical protein [Oscillospiraceae bacterium]
MLKSGVCQIHRQNYLGEYVSRHGVRKYTRAKKLTQRMLSELVDYIEV